MPLGAAEIAASVRARELDPLDAVEQALARIEEQAALHAFITVCGEQALSRARGPLEGALAGVPLLVKDSFDTAGVRTTVGSQVYAERVPTRSAPAVSALEAAGAVMVGKTNCDEFQWGVTGQNQFYGDVGNPTLPGRITGGSSSGNGAALAAGIAPLAVGTDTGGSVRMPAGCCDVVGMKPQLGRISTDGVFPLCPSFDTVGPMARTVADCALCFGVLSASPVRRHEVAGLRAGLLTAMPPLAPDVPQAKRDERALAFGDRLERLGLRAEEVVLAAPRSDIWPVFYGEAAATHRETFPNRRDEYGETVRAKLDQAQQVDPDAVSAGREALALWRAEAQAEPQVDVIACPTLGVYEVPRSDIDELEIRVAFSAYTRAFSFLGWPAIAIGSVQFAARDTGILFSVALAWEEAYGSP
jgi:aspartyl-tRNA(Asn)/glutamyl-tRNA(Gln) amidotransferase subunit A